MVNKRQHGFTLIELVIGIIVFAIAMAMMTSLLFPQVKRSVEPIYQLRAAELANALINEIQGKVYCENSQPWLVLCDQDTSGQALALGSDNESRDMFDDVDDYDGLTIDGVHLFSSAAYQELYINFLLNVEVFYDSDFDGVADSGVNALGAKLIKVTVITPSDESFEFAIYRSNY